MSRRNLISRPSFEAGVGAWEGGGVLGPMGTRGDAGTPQGTSYGYATAGNAGSGSFQSPPTPNGSVAAGQTYTGSLWLFRPTTGLVRFDLDWYDASDSYLSTTEVASTLTGGAWARRSVTGTAPVGADHARLFPVLESLAAGAVVGVDGAMLEPGSTLGTYGDGSSPGWEWDGAAHASTSRESDVELVLQPGVRLLEGYSYSSTYSDTSRTQGMEFGVDETGYITDVWAWRPSTSVAAPSAGGVWTVGGAQLGVFNWPSVGTATGWLSAALNQPIRVDPGTRYRVGVLRAGSTLPGHSNYWESGDGASGRRNGFLFAPNRADSSGQGCYTIGSSLAMPSSGSGSGANYGVDVTVAKPVPPPPSWAANETQADCVAAGYQDNGSQRQRGDGTFNDTSVPFPITLADAPGPRPGRAVPFTVPANYRRYEILPNHRRLAAGDDVWFGTAFYLGSDWPLDVAANDYRHQVIEQLRQYSDVGSPPVALEATRGKLLLTGGYGMHPTDPQGYTYERTLVEGLQRQRWYSVVYRVGPFSATAGATTIDVWVDGTQVVTGFVIPPPTLVGGDTLRKVGIYHDHTLPGCTLWLSGHATGASFAEVDPFLEPEGSFRPIGQPVETDAVTPLGRRHRRTLDQPVETDTATSVARARRRELGQAIETDAPYPVSSRRPGEARQAREVDTATSTGRAHRRDVTDTGEDDSASPLGRTHRRDLAEPIDAETATSLTRARRRDVPAQGAEVDAARPVGRVHTIRLGKPLEADHAGAIVHRARRRNIGQAVEVDTARPVHRRHRRDTVQAIEFDVARQLDESAGAVDPEAFSRAVASGDRRSYGTLEVDWSGDGTFAGPGEDMSPLIASVEIERALDGDLPEGAGLIDGYATASMKAELGGTRSGSAMSFASELAPWRTDSPLHGQRKTMREARAELGFITDDGPKAVRLFTGPVRDLNVGKGEVGLDAVDPSERMRAIITLPTYAEFITHAKRRNWALTVNTQWIVHHVLAVNGIHASPPPRDDAIIVCSGHGGLVANRGFNGAPISLPGQVPKTGLWTEDAHPYGLLGTPEPANARGTVGYQELYGITDGDDAPFRFQGGHGVGVSMLLHVGPWLTLGTGHEGRVLQVRPGDIYRDNSDNETPRLFLNWRGDGALYAGLVTSSGSIVATPWVPTVGPARWRHVGVFWRYTSDTTLVVTIRLDGQTRNYTLSVPSQTPARGYRPILQVNPQMTRAWSNLQVWVKPTAPTTAEWEVPERHVAQADVGRGNNELLYLPDVSSADSWEVLRAATDAELAVHGFTEFGRYYWRPRTDVRADRIDHVLDARINLADVGFDLTADTIRNSVGVTTTPRYHSGEFQAVVKAEDILQFVCPPGISRFDLDWPWGAAGRQGGQLPYYWVDQVSTPQWSGSVPQGYAYSYGTNWTGENNPYNVGVYFCQIETRKVRVTVNNTGSASVRLATDANYQDLAGQPGEPAMHLGGWPMVTQPARVSTWRNEDSIAELGGEQNGGERSLPLPASEWRQDDAALAPVAAALLDALADEVPLLEDLEVRGDPRIRAGNVAELRFPDSEVSVIGTVVKTRHRWSGRDGLRSQVTVRPLPISRLPENPGGEVAPAGWLFYIDISRYQAGIDLAAVKAAGYAGCVAKIGQGASSEQGFTATVDPEWGTFRDEGRGWWPDTFAGYWYVGDTESPAAQADRCLDVLGDPSIPVMLDWELGGGSWTNLLNVLSAFRGVGMNVTMLYTNLQAYAPSNGASNIDSTTGGLSVINSRYWLDSQTYPAQNPRTVFDDILATNPNFGRGTVLGATVDALQFTDAGTVYPGMNIDVNAFPGTPVQLAAMFNGSGA